MVTTNGATIGVSANCSKAGHWGAGAKPLLGSANTVQRAATGGAGAKPLLGSANTDWC